MTLETFEEQLERNKARGKLAQNIPPEIEAAAIALLEQESEAICGVKWVWAEQPAELHNRYRLWAFINASRAPNAAPPPAAVPEPRPDNWPLPSFDARDWAKEFCSKFRLIIRDHTGLLIDDNEGLMICWFANALMRGYDQREWEKKSDAWREIATATAEVPNVLLWCPEVGAYAIGKLLKCRDGYCGDAEGDHSPIGGYTHYQLLSPPRAEQG